MEPDDDPGSCAVIAAWLGLPAGSVEEVRGDRRVARAARRLRGGGVDGGRSRVGEAKEVSSIRLTWYGLTHPRPPTCASPPA